MPVLQGGARPHRTGWGDEVGLSITTNKVVDDWLAHYGCVLWPSTGKGFCGYESLAMSRAWLLAEAEKQGLRNA